MLGIMLLLAGCAGTVQKSETIKVGYVGAISGDPAYIGIPIQHGLELAVQEINAKGGVNGRQIELLVEDGKCNGKDAVNAYQKLKEVNGIDAVITMCSPELLGIAPVAAQTNTLVISPSATAPTITDAGAHVFRLAPSDALQGKEGARIIKANGYKTVGVLYVNHDYGVGLNNVLKAELGSQIVASDAYEPGAQDFRTQLTKMQDVDVIYMVAFPKEASLILKQKAELGMNMPVVAAEAAKDDVILPYGEGVLITVPTSRGSGYDAFAARYEAIFSVKPGLYAGEAYDTMQVVAKAAAADSANLVSGMQSVKEYAGVAGTVQFDANGDVAKPYDLFTVQNGQFMVVN